MENNQCRLMSNNHFLKISTDTIHFLKQRKTYPHLSSMYLELIYRCGRGNSPKGKSFFKNSALAQELQITAKKLTTILKKLQDEGLIIIDDSRKGHTVVSILDHENIIEKIV